jgi:hypothetical protein
MTRSFVIFVINTLNFEVMMVDLYALAICKHCNIYHIFASNKRTFSQDSCVLAVGDVFLSQLNCFPYFCNHLCFLHLIV